MIRARRCSPIDGCTTGQRPPTYAEASSATGVPRCGHRITSRRSGYAGETMDTRTGLPVVGMVGGGQLARMTHQAAIALGQSLRVLAVSPDDGAAMVAADTHLGTH